jgi:hypothetical protein
MMPFPPLRPASPDPHTHPGSTAAMWEIFDRQREATQSNESPIVDNPSSEIDGDLDGWLRVATDMITSGSLVDCQTEDEISEYEVGEESPRGGLPAEPESGRAGSSSMHVLGLEAHQVNTAGDLAGRSAGPEEYTEGGQMMDDIVDEKGLGDDVISEHNDGEEGRGGLPAEPENERAEDTSKHVLGLEVSTAGELAGRSAGPEEETEGGQMMDDVVEEKGHGFDDFEFDEWSLSSSFAELVGEAADRLERTGVLPSIPTEAAEVAGEKDGMQGVETSQPAGVQVQPASVEVSKPIGV